MPNDSMPEDVFPLSGGPSLNELVEMEPDHAFQCLDCEKIFETVLQWAQHAVGRHSDILPGIKPVGKQ